MQVRAPEFSTDLGGNRLVKAAGRCRPKLSMTPRRPPFGKSRRSSRRRPSSSSRSGARRGRPIRRRTSASAPHRDRQPRLHPLHRQGVRAHLDPRRRGGGVRGRRAPVPERADLAAPPLAERAPRGRDLSRRAPRSTRFGIGRCTGRNGIPRPRRPVRAQRSRSWPTRPSTRS